MINMHIGYMNKTVAEIIGSGFVLASIDYRFATQASYFVDSQQFIALSIGVTIKNTSGSLLSFNL